MKILIPVDGSDSARRAVQRVILMSAQLRETPSIYLLNVQWNIAKGNVKLFIGQQTINDYYREQGTTALAPACADLDAAGLAYTSHISVGTPAEAIVQYAQEQGVDEIVMGRQGESPLTALLLGSVVNKVLHLADMPVLLVK
jgi:nucleotide-binding universal stress UspA family protein